MGRAIIDKVAASAQLLFISVEKLIEIRNRSSVSVESAIDFTTDVGDTSALVGEITALATGFED
jgi:hypothetical protein